MELKLCDSCKSATETLFCRADSAFLCVNCDSTNKLASRHARVWVCEVCEQAPAHVTCKADVAALCVTCDRDIHSANPLASAHERVPVMFDFPEKMRLEERQRVMDKILCHLRNGISSFVTCSTPHDFLVDSYAVHIIDNQSHNNVMDMNVVDSSIEELLNLNEVSSTPSAKSARDQSLLSLPASDIDAKEVSIKGKRKIETEAPSASKKKSINGHHVQKENGEDGKTWVKCNYYHDCEFKRKHYSKQGTTVWKNNLERHHNVKLTNVQESSQMTGVEKFKDASCVPTDVDQVIALVSEQRSSPLSPRNETQRIPISGGNCKEVSPANNISEDIPEEQSDHENSNGLKFEYHEFENNPSEKVVFTADDIAAGSKPWENALVGYVLGLKPTLAEMACFAKQQWGNLEVPKVLLLDDGVFLFAFESPDKKRIVWESQWAYSGHLLVLREWTCDLDVYNVEVLRRVHIWVEFPKLPLVLWNPKSLGRLARHLGRPLATDKSTKNPQNQLKCARLLIEVEVDTMDKLPLSIPVDLPWKSFNQTVVFDRESVKNSFIASKKAGGTTVLICGYTSEEKNLLEQWRKHKPIGEIVTTVGTIDVADTSLARLVPPQENVATPYHDLHIDDTVIDAYFHLLKKRCDMHPNKYRKHHFFNCFMATQICGKANNLSRWYKLEDLADVCKLFLPVHVQLPLDLNHWVLLCVNIKDRQLLWMDSIEGLQKFYKKERDIISEWFVGTLLPDMGYKEANWDVIVRDDIPKQETAFDCGVFVMKYADCLTRGDCFPFSQSDMVRFRERIFLDIFPKLGSVRFGKFNAIKYFRIDFNKVDVEMCNTIC